MNVFGLNLWYVQHKYLIYGNAHGVRVIIVGNRHGNQSSNSG